MILSYGSFSELMPQLSTLESQCSTTVATVYVAPLYHYDIIVQRRDLRGRHRCFFGEHSGHTPLAIFFSPSLHARAEP